MSRSRRCTRNSSGARCRVHGAGARCARQYDGACGHLESEETSMRIRAHGFTFLAASLLMADLAASPTQAGKPAAPQAAATAAIQSQDTNIAGIVAELTDCTRKDGVLTIKVRLRNTSTATIEVAVFQALSDLRKFYVTAENKKYFILADS